MDSTYTNQQLSFINDILLPTIHPHLDELIPRLFDATHGTYDARRSEWKSKYHIDSGLLDSDGSYTTKAPSHIGGDATYFLLYDFGHGGVKREVLNEIANTSYHGMRGEAIKDLSSRYGLEDKYNSMYMQHLTPEQKQRLEAEDQCASDLCTARDIFIEALWGDSDEAHQALEYMRSRGWSDDDIKNGLIGLITPTIKAHVNELTKGRIASRWSKAIGETHTIAIPFAVNGRMSAFQFRTIDGANADKYLYETHVSKKDLYGYVKGTRNLVITEGCLDYVHAIAKGLPNIVTSGGNPSAAQLTNLTRYTGRMESITLFFDDDKGGRKHTNTFADRLITQGKKDAIRIAHIEPIEGVMPKDIDEWLGIINAHPDMEAMVMYDKTLANTMVYDEWKPIDIELTFAEKILLKDETDKKKRNRGFNHVDEEMIAAIAQVASREEIRGLMQDMKQFFYQCDKEYVESAREHWQPWESILGKPIQSLITTKEDIKAREKRERIQLNVKRLYGAMKDVDEVEMRKCIEELHTDTKEEVESDEDMWSKYGSITITDIDSIEKAHEALASDPEGIPTCITFTDGSTDNYERVVLEPGLTFICANTGHGKTSILNRIVIDEAIRNKKLGTDKGVLYFTYEISRNELMRDLLRIYVDDPDMAKGSKRPREAMRRYFNYGDDLNFNPGTFDEARNISHFQHFKQRLDEFEKYYITRNGYINIVQESLSYENLIKVVESYIHEAARRKRNGLGKDISFMCLDYAQLLFTDEEMIRTEQITEICRGLNDLGRKYGIPIVMPAQFNQSVVSPYHMELRCIGEGGGFSRYGIAVYGFFALNVLGSVGSDADSKNKYKLQKFGITFADDIKPLNNIMYAKILKTRKGIWLGGETLLYWDSKLKTIKGNTNPYIADPSMARVDGMSIREAIKKGRKELGATADKMIESIEMSGVGKPNNVWQVMKTLDNRIIKDEDDPNEHPEYSDGEEQSITYVGAPTAEAMPPLEDMEEGEPLDPLNPDNIPIYDEDYCPY